MVYLNQT